jgi:hypothetical protein
MAASTWFDDQARIQPVSHVLRAATAADGGVEGGQGTASGDRWPLFASAAVGEHGSTEWERAYRGTADQLRYLRAAVQSVLRNCPVADDAIFLMSELGGNAVRHSRSREDGGTFTARLLDVPALYVLGEVEDSGSDWSGDIQGSARNASGLDVLLKLSDACGVSGDASRRVVWFRLRYPAAGGGLPGRAAGDA